MKIKQFTVLFVGLMCSTLSAIADDPKTEKINQFETYFRESYQELIYIQLDKQCYLTGEHIKFKVYCLEQLALTPSQLSKVAYLELLDTENTPKLQMKVSLKNGVGYGDVYIPTNLSSGNFILRGYTRWMQNHGAETFYHSMVSIINPFRKLGLKSIPEKDDILLKFFPESGVIINGEKTIVVFESKNSNGYPANFKGKLVASDTILVTEFEPVKNGMGSFEFTPDSAGKYHVELTHEDNTITKYEIPDTIEKGLALNVYDSENKSHITIFCNDSSIVKNSEILFYIIHGNGKILKSNNVTLSEGRASFEIENTLLADGVSTISLFNSEGKFLRSRNIFRYIKKNNSLSIDLDKNKYHTREKVTINISALGVSIPLDSINLSISVAAYHDKFKNKRNELLACLSLKKTLKGYICDLESYFEGSESEITSSINNLLIAYGNKINIWHEKESKNLVKYIPEYRGQIITGKVWNKILNEPAHSILTYLSIPGEKVQFYASKSRIDGSIIFEVKDFYGENEIVLQNDYTKDTIYDIQIDNPFSEKYVDYDVPVFDVNESMKDWIEHMSQNMQIENVYMEFQPKLPLISMVDSSNFYNVPDSRYYLDDFTRFIVMEEVMREYVYGVYVRKKKDGFHINVLDLEKEEIYYENPLMLLDGVPVFDANEIIALDPLKIKKIETVKRRFFKGVLDCKGIVNYTTYDGDLNGYTLHKNALVFQYLGVQLMKQYYFPEYSSSFEKRITSPDFRNVLYWNPEISLDKKGNSIIEFYTSDDLNKYEIRIEGISDTGKTFSSNSYFEVVPGPDSSN